MTLKCDILETALGMMIHILELSAYDFDTDLREWYLRESHSEYRIREILGQEMPADPIEPRSEMIFEIIRTLECIEEEDVIRDYLNAPNGEHDDILDMIFARMCGWKPPKPSIKAMKADDWAELKYFTKNLEEIQNNRREFIREYYQRNWVKLEYSADEPLERDKYPSDKALDKEFKRKISEGDTKYEEREIHNSGGSI